MPAPAVYIVGVGVVVVGVATAIVVKQHVWEPHIAPTIDRWTQTLKAHREAAKQRRRDRMVRMSSSGNSVPPPQDNRDSVELSNIATGDREAAATGVDEAHEGLRQRRPAAPSTQDQLSNSNSSLTYIPMSPTHVVSNRSEPSTPSTIRSTSSAPQLPAIPYLGPERLQLPILPLSPASSKLSDDLPTVGIQPGSPIHHDSSPFADPIDPVTPSHTLSDVSFHSPRSELLSVSGRESPNHSEDFSEDEERSVIASDIGSLSASEMSSWASVEGSQRH